MSDEENTVMDDENNLAGQANGSEPVEGEIVADSAELSLEEQLELSQAEASKNLDGWQRTLAEFSNARKRMDKQLRDANVNATVQLVTKLLPIIDDLALAAQSVPEEIAESDWFTGIEMVQRKLNNMLTASQIETIAAVGEPFDPNLHEAVMPEATEEYESGIVTRELRTGYKLGDRVIRPSLVAVAT